MSQLFELSKNDATWAIIFAVFLYLSGAWLRPLVAKIPNTNWLFRVIRLVHLVLNKVDPGGNVAKDATKLTAIAFVLFASLTQTACAASFEEARLASSTATRKSATRDDNECKDIDRRHRIWGGIEYGALAATGASGLAPQPTMQVL